MRPRTTRILLGAALLATLAAAWFAPSGETATVSEAVPAAPMRPSAAAATGERPAHKAAAQSSDVLRIRARELDADGVDEQLFSSTVWAAPAAPAAPVSSAPAAPQEAAMQPPPLPFRVLGSYEQAGETVVFLQQNDQNHVVRVGDTIADTYKVESLDGGVMKLRYLPLDQVQSLELGRTFREK